MNYMDIDSFLNFLRIPSTTVQILKPTRASITSPEDLDAMKLFCNSTINIDIVTVVIDRVDSWNFYMLIRKVNVTSCTVLVVLKGKKPIQAYASRLLGKVLTSNCSLFLESGEVIPTISISDGRILCERVDLKGLYFEKCTTTHVVFSNCTISKYLALFVPNSDLKAKKEPSELRHTGVKLEIRGCSQSFHDRFEVIESVFCTAISLKQDPAHRLVLRDKLLGPVWSLDIENVDSIERCTINSSMLSLKWFCNSRFYKTSLLPHTPLITNICSATLKYLIIDSNIDGVNPVIADINAPDLNIVYLGGPGSKFRCYDSGDVSSFLKNVPVMELELYNTYQPLQTRDCLSTVVKLTIQLHDGIQNILFPCQFPSLADLQLKGTIRSLNEFTSRIYAPHLTSLGVDFISWDRTVASVDEAPKIVKRIVEMYPKLEELAVATLPTHGVLQRPDITASVLMLSSRLKRLRTHGVDVDVLRSNITFLKLETLFIDSGFDFEMNIIVPKLEFLDIY